MKIVIVDDEPLARLRMRQLCEDAHSSVPHTVLAEFSNTQSLIVGLSTLSPDVLLMDINMPGVNGIDFAAYLQKTASRMAVIFVTAQSNHAIDAFEVHAVDYLLKPVRLERFIQALDKAKLHLALQSHSTNNSTLVLKANKQGKDQEISASDVLYFKADHKLTSINTLNDTYHCDLSLNELEHILATHGIACTRIHRNTLILDHAIGQVCEEDNGTNVTVQGLDVKLRVSRRGQLNLRKDTVSFTNAHKQHVL